MARMRSLLSDVDLAAGLCPTRVSVGEVVYPPGGRLGPRRQRDVQLVLVHAGSARIAVDGVARPRLAAGSVALLLPGHTERFAFADDAPTRHAWVQVGLEAPPPGLMERLRALPVALPASGALSELVRAAVAASRSPLPTAAPLVAALAAASLWRYVGEGEAGVPGDVVDRARRIIHARLADPGLDLGGLAAAVNVSPAHLVRRFRAELGVTPIAYVWQRRVETGIDLLVHTGLPVGDVAARAGFRSVYHFSRRVKQHAGVSPTRLRRDRWRGSA
jgi:AraC-like DNA-binding protein